MTVSKEQRNDKFNELTKSRQIDLEIAERLLLVLLNERSSLNTWQDIWFLLVTRVNLRVGENFTLKS